VACALAPSSSPGVHCSLNINSRREMDTLVTKAGVMRMGTGVRRDGATKVDRCSSFFVTRNLHITRDILLYASSFWGVSLVLVFSRPGASSLRR
jgi:hypothetical protein